MNFLVSWGPCLRQGPLTVQPPSPNLPPGKQVAEDATPSEPTPPNESDTAQANTASPSFSRAPASEASRTECVGAPQGPPEGSVPTKDPLEDFTVPPVGTPFWRGVAYPLEVFLLDAETRPYAGRDLVRGELTRFKQATRMVCDYSRR